MGEHDTARDANTTDRAQRRSRAIDLSDAKTIDLTGEEAQVEELQGEVIFVGSVTGEVVAGEVRAGAAAGRGQRSRSAGTTAHEGGDSTMARPDPHSPIRGISPEYPLVRDGDNGLTAMSAEAREAIVARVDVIRGDERFVQHVTALKTRYSDILNRL